jgi:hypothetical protein
VDPSGGAATFPLVGWCAGGGVGERGTERKREDLEREREENKHRALCAFVPLAGQILG